MMGFNFCCYSHYQSEAQVTQLSSFLPSPSLLPPFFPSSLRCTIFTSRMSAESWLWEGSLVQGVGRVVEQRNNFSQMTTLPFPSFLPSSPPSPPPLTTPSFSPPSFQMTFQFREWDKRRPLHTNPSLDYLAPEYILSKSCNELSDIYSFGMLCYAAYNHGKPLYESQNNMLSFKQNIEQVHRSTVLKCRYARTNKLFRLSV